jgi:hypothetical protein
MTYRFFVGAGNFLPNPEKAPSAQAKTRIRQPFSTKLSTAIVNARENLPQRHSPITPHSCPESQQPAN